MQPSSFIFSSQSIFPASAQEHGLGVVVVVVVVGHGGNSPHVSCLVESNTIALYVLKLGPIYVTICIFLEIS